MKPTVLVRNLILLLSITFYLNFILAESTLDEQIQHEKDAFPKSKSTALWFSPRIGRRKRNSPFDDNFTGSTTLEKERLEDVIDTIQSLPLPAFTLNGKYLSPILETKRQTVNYIPRLGRESGETTEEGWLQDQELTKELMMQRSPPFAPRLGRRRDYDFDPRLGRRVHGKL